MDVVEDAVEDVVEDVVDEDAVGRGRGTVEEAVEYVA